MHILYHVEGHEKKSKNFSENVKTGVRAVFTFLSFNTPACTPGYYLEMKKKNYILFYRELIDHPTVGFERPFSKAEAWIWLLSEAKYEDTAGLIDFGGKKRYVEQPRGTVTHSIRFLASAWGWNSKRVIRYLKTLKNDHSIALKRQQQITQISICNYNNYQPEPGTAEGTANMKNDHSKGYSRGYSKGYKHNEYNEYNKRNELKEKRFVVPNPYEVEEYAKSIEFDLNGFHFCDYYQSKGWMIGKNKMKDWKAAVRTWKQKKLKDEPIENEQPEIKKITCPKCEQPISGYHYDVFGKAWCPKCERQIEE